MIVAFDLKINSLTRVDFAECIVGSKEGKKYTVSWKAKRTEDVVQAQDQDTICVSVSSASVVSAEEIKELREKAKLHGILTKMIREILHDDD